ncbi:NAD dependent epimerase/dehydratase family protein [Pleomorphomonas sp. SM30]|uniref:Nucleoside-diphosphate-sugar epimerase n=1 Tax=Oharaeibacter diazotrophicus TaxID=1920512 RepID=A0A4R6R7M3_9HYPH|nr:SDR family oxidoreductase [Oharaeibacter diazotrophicus]TDP81990.1 nucleoside-diphosphate-sugar epimerase [Oharaeibacter diazotrophicus]BBE73622.1 NAD dependent epimerase/dehydratase family protein [Pleomorphomonas sp. SM30]GLS75411.1 NAD(P)-dependent oxidoreductase [Oharaeibacter diazotrophicus]
MQTDGATVREDGVRLFVFGYGYSAAAAVRRLAGPSTEVAATTRDPAKAEAMRAAGIDAIVFDGRDPAPRLREALARASHVLVSVAPGEAGDPVLNVHGADLALARSLASIVYLSTVGVYGDHGGAWVDERTPEKPVSARSVARLAAEARWRRHGAMTKVPVAILRLSGIYGPGRNAFVNLADGTARRLVKPGQVFNRIHVDDIAEAVRLAFRKGADGVFNVTDDEPSPPQDVVAHAAALMGVAPPPEQDFETADLSPMARSFYGENKRVANARSKRELGLVYGYPNHRVALERMWREDGWR